MYLAIIALTLAGALLGYTYYTSRDPAESDALGESFHRAQAGQQEHYHGD